MKKLALFVEGQTEQLFAHRLIEEVAGRHHIAVETIKASGGRATPRLFTQILASSPTGKKYYVLIYDCGGDRSVLSDLLDQYETLIQAGYDQVLGLRDVYPNSSADVERAIAPWLPTAPIPVAMILAITEIEAWFLAEESHYVRIHPGLTPAVIAQVLGCPPEQVAVETIFHPSETLDQIYRMVGLFYRKDRKRLQKVVEALDCANLYVQVVLRVTALARFLSEIDRFLSP